MTDKVQKIREEVVRLRNLHQMEYQRLDASDNICLVECDKRNLCDNLLEFIDSLQEEPVSEELEIAANEWDAKASFTPFYMALDDKGNPNGVRQDYTTHAESFKAGAQWDKEQMMAKAIDGYVIEDIEEGNGDFLLSAEYLPKSMGLKDQQKVKVIVIRED